mmetsp:Transcript_142831/g.249118  ORF Transcript_142831/g.249118 Transcript_142831/m.249118 type:complete len:268 (-) Transcript_142831:294-1097(-)
MAVATPFKSFRTPNGAVLVWDAATVFALRTQHRLIGSPIGCVPGAPQQNIINSLPYYLSDEEVFVGVSEGFLLVCEDDRERSATQPPDSTSEDPASMYISIPTSTPSPVLAHSSWDPVEEFGSKLQCVVFHDLWKKGWYITSGSKFGADFLLYPGDPAQYHATCLVLVRPPSQALTCNEWIAAARVAHGAKKVLLLASQAGSDDDIPSQPDTGPAPAPAPPDPSHDTTESARSPGHELKATGADQGIRQSAPRGSILYVTVQWRKAF